MTSRQVAASIKPLLLPVLELLCRIAASSAAFSHRMLMATQWRIGDPPEHFDHNLDLYFQWRHTRSSLWLERGVFGSLALKGEDVLELACGDGFNARNFYSLRSRRVVACDFDPDAISLARSKNGAPNVLYVLADIRNQLPNGVFGNIVWDAAIEHFTEEEIGRLLPDIKARLAPGGVLSGYTMVENASGIKSLHQHEYEFKDKQDLFRFLEPHFKHVTVFETIYPARHNLYFWASDDVLPFRADWNKMVAK